MVRNEIFYLKPRRIPRNEMIFLIHKKCPQLNLGICKSDVAHFGGHIRPLRLLLVEEMYVNTKILIDATQRNK